MSNRKDGVLVDDKGNIISHVYGFEGPAPNGVKFYPNGTPATPNPAAKFPPRAHFHKHDPDATHRPGLQGATS